VANCEDGLASAPLRLTAGRSYATDSCATTEAGAGRCLLAPLPPGAEGRRGAAWCRPRVDRQGRHLAGRKVWRVSARKYQFAVTRRASTMTGAVPGPACTALMTMIALRFRKRQEQEGKDRVIAAWRGSSTYLDVVARRTGRIRGRG
jgi:hypothetical protein